MSLKTEIDKVNENTNNVKAIKANIDNEFVALGEAAPTSLNEVPAKINALGTSLSTQTLNSAKEYTDSKVGDLSTLKTTNKNNVVGSINDVFDLASKKEIAWENITNKPATFAPNKSTKHGVVLNSASWGGTKAPYNYSITIPGMDTEKNWEVTNSVSPLMTEAEIDAFSKAKIICGNQSTDTVTLIAYGEKPTIDINILVIVRGD